MVSPPAAAGARSAALRIALAAGAATLVVVALVWPWLPPVHQDEYLPIYPLAWYTKTPEARPAGLRHWVRSFDGGRLVVPLRAYHYIGASKGLLWATLGLPTEPGPYRATNGVGVALLVALLAWAAWRFSGRSTLGAALAVAFLAGDVSFVVLGITDEGPILIHLMLATLLAILLASLAVRARWWLVVPVALVVTLGLWDRLNFGWFVGAGLAGCVAAAPAVRPWRRAAGMLAVASAGTAAGVYPIHRLLPDYLDMARRGLREGIGLADPARLLGHARAMLELVDPLAAYHRYADLAPRLHDPPWVLYRWAFAALLVAAVTAAAVGGLRRRDPQRLFVAGFTAALAAAVVRTNEAWASHHVVVVKPFVYLALAAAAGAATRARAPLAAGSAAVALAFAALGVLGVVRLQSGRPVTGVYDVSWNSTEAWRAAAAADVRRVYALDWGAYYPGVVNSPPAQRWEAREVANLRSLMLLDHGSATPFGVLFRTDGPHRWIAGAAAQGRWVQRLRAERFDRHPGEPWAFMVLAPPATPPATEAARDPTNLVRNGDFLDADVEWRLESFTRAPGDPELRFEPCGSSGGRCVGIRLAAPNDARLVQEVTLPAASKHELRAIARAEGTAIDARGAHVVLMDHPVESEDLRGTTGWHELRVVVDNPGPAVTVKLGLRLGTYGSLTRGTGWFGEVSVRRLEETPRDVRTFTLGRR